MSAVQFRPKPPFKKKDPSGVFFFKCCYEIEANLGEGGSQNAHDAHFARAEGESRRDEARMAEATPVPE